MLDAALHRLLQSLPADAAFTLTVQRGTEGDLTYTVQASHGRFATPVVTTLAAPAVALIIDQIASQSFQREVEQCFRKS